MRRGFTLVETMIVLVLVGILTGLAAVGWQRFTWQIKVRGAMDDLRGAIQLARSDAMTKRHNSGILIDVDGLRYLRFIDSSASGNADGLYNAGESVIQNWTSLPQTMFFYGSPASSISPTPPIRKCDQPATTSTGAAQTGMYSIVFRSDGSSWASFDAQIGVQSFTDKFHLFVLPSTGWIALEK